jgi:AraC-like DNA-binding protein
MKRTLKRRVATDSLRIYSSGSNEWRFLLVTDTMRMVTNRSVFLTRGDLVVLRPGEKADFSASAYKGVCSCDSFVKKCLDVFSVALYKKWKEAEEIIITLYGAEKLFDVFDEAANALDQYTVTFLLKQIVAGCIAQAVGKDKYGQQALPPQVRDALALLKDKDVLRGNFAQYRAKCAMSESNLVRLFALYNLEIPSETFRKAKFAYAKQLLEEGKSVQDASREIGYGAKRFVKLYKDYYGALPKTDDKPKGDSEWKTINPLLTK